MTRLSLTVENITPLLVDSRYIRGGQALRADSIIGMLRFWLRALCGRSYRNADRAVFGAKGTPSAVSIRMLSSTVRQKKKPEGTILYLACGMQRHRCFDVGSEFRILLSVKDDERLKKLLFCAIRGLVIFGGLGARTRRGFGAIRLSPDGADEVFSPPETVEGVKEAIKALLEETGELSADFEKEEALPSVSFASKETEVYLSRSIYPDAETAQRHGGELLRRWRNRNNSRDALKDHDMVYEFARTERIDNVPFRAIFGLPHHYFLRNLGGGRTATVTFEPAGSTRRITRRASPLVLSVVPLKDGKASLLFALFRSQFMPRSVPIQVHGFRHADGERERLPLKILGRHPSWRSVLSFTDSLIASGEFDSVTIPQTDDRSET